MSPRRPRQPARRSNGRIVLFLALVGILLAWAAWQFRPQIADETRVTLVRVSDGDTVVVKDAAGRDIKVRLIGVDAPELGTAASFRSALFVAELAEAAGELRLEPDPHRSHDKYGRVLGWLWVTSVDGQSLLLNEELIRQGHATFYEDTSPRAKYYDRVSKH